MRATLRGGDDGCLRAERFIGFLAAACLGAFLWNRSSRGIPIEKNVDAVSSQDIIAELPISLAPTESPSSPPRTYEDLLRLQLQICGSLCAVSKPAPARFDVTLEHLNTHLRTTTISCSSLLSKSAEGVLEARPYEWPPPKQIPASMLDEYTIKGSVGVSSYYLYVKYSGAQAMVPSWTRNMSDIIMKELRARTHYGTYGVGSTNFLMDVLMKANLRGLHVVVVGSEKPWIEIICLLAGARRVTTIEYGRIESQIEAIDAMTPFEAADRYRQGRLDLFDVVVSFSSLEHAGLGRYGDCLNPWGDVIAVAKLWCFTKARGRMFLGLPSAASDEIAYNAHRLYGPNRWPLVLTNWKAVSLHRDPASEHLFVEAIRLD